MKYSLSIARLKKQGFRLKLPIESAALENTMCDWHVVSDPLGIGWGASFSSRFSARFLSTIPQGFSSTISLGFPCAAHKKREAQPQILKHTGFHRISQKFTDLHRLVCEIL